ncbi:hypothetical protein CWR43_14345 [Rhizobium sullae]|uniref:Uncharacterized protein n=1 Tax=Rhizobium sullae TaxID=50338 RepID=A0A2N0DAU7_RHISU|nr:hypothetical protein CWR43_14345 [Rhizobium sullae]
MTSKTDQSELRYIPFETDDDMVRHLQALPEFAVPANSDHVFGAFLERLEAVNEGGEQSPSAGQRRRFES